MIYVMEMEKKESDVETCFTGAIEIEASLNMVLSYRSL